MFEALLRRIRESARPAAMIEQDEGRDLILLADVIWGYDRQRDQMPLFYGKALLNDIAKGRDAEFGHLMLLCFELDLAGDDADHLCQAVQELKGDCCYVGRDAR